MGLKSILALSALFISTALAVSPLKVQGSNFVDSVTNQRFEIIGVEYGDPPSNVPCSSLVR